METKCIIIEVVILRSYSDSSIDSFSGFRCDAALLLPKHRDQERGQEPLGQIPGTLQEVAESSRGDGPR